MDDLQEMFSKVRAHLLTQKAKSVINEQCVYRGPNGMKCAIGCLIPDEEYREDFERKTVTTLAINTSWGVFEFRSISKRNLAQELQHIHDRCDVAGWETALRYAAADFHLKNE